jgi:hypothetical protein
LKLHTGHCTPVDYIEKGTRKKIHVEKEEKDLEGRSPAVATRSQYGS